MNGEISMYHPKLD